jgi:hypothetical protein
MTRVAAMFSTLAMIAGEAFAQPVDVTVHMQGERVTIDVTAQVAASHAVAWSVLTDYDHMADYVSTLKSSKILSRKANELEVAQTGEAHRAFLHFSFSTVEFIGESEIHSHLIRGDSKSYEFTTRLIDGTGDTLRIVHHGEYVPKRWVPPIVGPAMIETETRKQYADLLAEMSRRQAK